METVHTRIFIQLTLSYIPVDFFLDIYPTLFSTQINRDEKSLENGKTLEWNIDQLMKKSRKAESNENCIGKRFVKFTKSLTCQDNVLTYLSVSSEALETEH